MPSTYSDQLRLELQAAGENSGSWGTIVNTVFALLEDAVASVASVSMPSDANYTLTANNGSADEARCAILEVASAGSLTATRDIIVPTVEKWYIVSNATTGSQSIRVKTSAGTGITITNGKKRLVYCDGTNVVDGINDLPSGTTIGGGSVYSAGGTDVAVADGGTGASTAADARTNLGVGTGDSPQFTAINLGHASDTTIARTGAGDIAIEGNAVYRAGGTDVAVADGGTGASTAAGAATNLGLGTGDSPQFAGINLGHASDTTLTRAAAGDVAVEGVTLMKVGKKAIPIPASAMVANTTNGPSSGTNETTTNKVMYRTLDFDTTTQEGAQFLIPMPSSWDEGTVTFQPCWTAASGSGGVVFELRAVALSNDDALDTAFGTGQTSTDTLIAAGDVHWGPESSAITIAGTPAANDLVIFQIRRNVSDGSDTLGVDAKLIAIRLFITTNASIDS